MDLKQQQIHRTYKKCEAKNQITLGNDYSVPEGKPAVAKILQKRAELSVDEVHAEKGKVKIKGILKVWVFYLAQRSSRTADSFLMEIPFDEMLATMYTVGKRLPAELRETALGGCATTPTACAACQGCH